MPGMRLSTAIRKGLPMIDEQSHTEYLHRSGYSVYCQACALGTALLGADYTGADPRDQATVCRALAALRVAGSRTYLTRQQLQEDPVTAPLQEEHFLGRPNSGKIPLYGVVDQLNYELKLSHESIADWLASHGW